VGQVARSLGRLESVTNFTEFVKAFSQFGAEMVELAHLTGDRQNDLKDERRRAQMAAARQVLERSTMMLLTSSKVRLCCGISHNTSFKSVVATFQIFSQIFEKSWSYLKILGTER
jgi:hypothetical protein